MDEVVTTEPAGPIKAGEPLFIVCSPRSGSTLLSRLLGMHDRVVVPAETNLSAACQVVLQAAGTLGQELVDDEASAKRERKRAVTHARRMATGIIRGYLEREEADIFADKSLTNADQAELLAECFPGARFVCLHRHCLDVVCSLIEACPWGFEAYGAAPFVGRNPANFVAGLVDKWICTTRAEVEFAKAHPELCMVMRYEDLARDPASVMGRLFGWLGLEAPESLGSSDGAQMSLEMKANSGPADYKISFTSYVDTASIGRGRRLPFAAIPAPLLEMANELLGGLGYDKVDEGWNRSVALGELAACTEGGRVTLEVIVAQLEKRLANGGESEEWKARVALEDVGASLVVDFGARTVCVESGLSTEALCVGLSSALLGALLGHVNVGTILRRGELRLCDPAKALPGQAQEGQLDKLLELLVPPAPIPVPPALDLRAS